MKRTYRNDMPQAQKDKLSAINTGKILSQSTKDKISRSMQDYWNSLPYKPTDNKNPMQPPKPPQAPTGNPYTN